MDPRGIQPGTAVTIWLKKPASRSGPSATRVLYRDFWGLANWKRQALIASLPDGNLPPGSSIPAYIDIGPSRENRWRLSPHTQEAGYESWPGLDELFPIAFQGVNHNRGLEGSVIDTDRAALARRMQLYFRADSFAQAAKVCPDVATARARYNPAAVWAKLKDEGGYKVENIKPFLVSPFDKRWIYYEPTHKWLNEARPKFGANLDDNEFLVTVPEPRKATETRPLYATTLVNLHVHERGSVVIPRETAGDGFLTHRDANLPESTWRVLRAHFGLTGDRKDEPARALVGRLLRLALAVLYSSAYQADHQSALSADWAHLPIPKDSALFERLVETGEAISRLLDVERDGRDVVIALLGGEERVAALAQLRRKDGGQIRPDDLKVTVNYWGGSRGGWVPRSYAMRDYPLAAWGERTGDLYIGDTVFFANVPEKVWTYQLGGYPVLKKWLGYRQANRRDDCPLSADERRWFRNIVQRIAALLALEENLNALYSAAAEGAFTATELAISR